MRENASSKTTNGTLHHDTNLCELGRAPTLSNICVLFASQDFNNPRLGMMKKRPNSNRPPKHLTRLGSPDVTSSLPGQSMCTFKCNKKGQNNGKPMKIMSKNILQEKLVRTWANDWEPFPPTTFLQPLPLPQKSTAAENICGPEPFLPHAFCESTSWSFAHSHPEVCSCP